MCVIIYRKPGTTIPFNKLKSACIVNADGMGLVAIDRGKMELRKYFDKKGNSPDTLQKFLEDAKDLHVYAHLRYRTKGATDKSNVHPFGILKSKKHGIDLQFMHNGTLSDFGTNDVCDSKHFVKTFLAPLTERLLKAIDPNELLHDPVYKEILNKYAGRSSVFLLADNLGNHQIVNYDNGKEFDGWWASNEYSFNRYHRDKDEGDRYYSYGYYGRSAYRDSDWNYSRSSPQNDKTPVSLAKVPVKALVVAGDTRHPFNDEIPFETAKAEATKEVATSAPANPTLTGRERFTDIASISSLSDLVGLSREDVADMVDEYPEHTVILILDLLKELYDRDREYDDIADAREAA